MGLVVLFEKTRASFRDSLLGFIELAELTQAGAPLEQRLKRLARRNALLSPNRVSLGVERCSFLQSSLCVKRGCELHCAACPVPPATKSLHYVSRGASVVLRL